MIFRRALIRRPFTTASISTNTPTSQTLPIPITKGPNEIINTQPSMRTITRTDPIVKSLFRPFIHADFIPTTDSRGVQHPPAISQDELRQLRRYALMLGLNPESDLNLPPLEKPAEDNIPVDGRLAAELQYYRSKRLKKDERIINKEAKQNLLLLKQGKMTMDDIEVKDPYEKEYLPLRLRPKKERDLYMEEKRKRVEALSATMDRVVEEWKAKRREQRKKLQTLGAAQKGNQKNRSS